MGVTIIAIVVLLFLILIIGGGFLLYSLFTSSTKPGMQVETKTKALDVFLYIGVAISLITSVTNFLQIIFAAINRKFIDVLAYTGYEDMTSSDVRFAIASLLVMFPIYVLLSWYIGKDIKRFLYKQDIMVRKVVIYFTLFVAVLTLIGTLVSVIYTYLGGELSMRFGFKALAIFVVAAGLFGYYYYSLNRNYARETMWPLMIAIGTSLLVLLSIIWSVSVIGTPQEMRAKKVDSTRLSDISRIQQEIFNRFQMTDKLPSALTELDNAFQGYQVPTDPLTKEVYGYKLVQQGVVKLNYTTNKKELVTPAIFEVCATFETEREFDVRGQSVSYGKGGVAMSDSFYSASNYYYEGDRSPFWNHGIGETCFKRMITPEMYYGR